MGSGQRVTGERVVPEEYARTSQGRLIHLLHVVTYKFCLALVRGRSVLDFGCGTGYGTALVAPDSADVMGVDVSPEAIAHAASAHSHPNLSFRTIDPSAERTLPFQDASFDVVLSIQVLEHVGDPEAYLAEARRVLRPSGTMVVATPDRTTRLFSFQRPWNEFHVREYSAESLQALMGTVFQQVDVNTMSGTADVIAPELRRTRLMKWMTLPVTLPGMPDPLRRAALRGLKAAARAAGRIGISEPASPAPIREDDVRIGPALAPSVNLIAVGRL